MMQQYFVVQQNLSPFVLLFQSHSSISSSRLQQLAECQKQREGRMLQLYFASGLALPCLALHYILAFVHSLFVPLLVSLPYNTKACSQKEGHKNEYLQNSEYLYYICFTLRQSIIVFLSGLFLDKEKLILIWPIHIITKRTGNKVSEVQIMLPQSPVIALSCH